MLNILSNLNNRLRSEVDRIGISKLSRELGIARNTIYNWCEKGNIPLDKLSLLGEYGLDINYIVSGTKEYPALSAEETVIISKYREADISMKKEILMLLLVGSVETPTRNENKAENTSECDQFYDKKQKVENMSSSNLNDGKVKIKAKGVQSQAAFNITNNGK